MQAIHTKYHGPTNHQGARITARCDAKRITVPYDHALSSEENHRAAAGALSNVLGWGGDTYGIMVSGSLPSGGYAHTFTSRGVPMQLAALRALVVRITKGGWPHGNPYSVPEIKTALNAIGWDVGADWSEALSKTEKAE